MTEGRLRRTPRGFLATQRPRAGHRCSPHSHPASRDWRSRRQWTLPYGVVYRFTRPFRRGGVGRGYPPGSSGPSLCDNDGWDASLPPTRRPLRPVECPSSVQRIVTGLTMARTESLDVVPGAGQAPKLARAEDALRSKPRGSQQGQVSVWIWRFIPRLAGYKILVGTGPSSRR